jgi:exodeoxyribonuclease V alpha subunit
LSLAYAITIHKSQGSEFKTVILPLFNYSMPTIYNRNLLYTAITRAKSYCCIIGQRNTTNKMIHNNKINKRRTTLMIRLNGESDEVLKMPKKTTKKSTTSAKKKTK